MKIVEKTGSFYLGKEVSQTAKKKGEAELFNLDSKRLTTHAVCVGMTGSGKTGLGIALLEEAGIGKIPALIIDPKGDLGNLLLTFPKLMPSDFLPWVDEEEAGRKKMTPAAYADYIAKTWKEGLSNWGEGPERIRELRNAVDMAIYTPASKSGIPLSILSTFKAPPKEILEDPEAIRDRVLSTSSSILGLLGIDADPVKSREHILISNIITYAWNQGKDLAINSLIQYVQKPPFDKIGALDIDTFFSPKERIELSITLNNLLASPGFQAWMEGEPLDVQNLLYTQEGKPRLAILSIAHLSEAERMFFVTILLNEVLSWMRRQPGTSSLRALLYMDEIFGFFPPTGMPSSKIPMLTLLKQARAFGLGVVLATQNPVDLDYKGLSNCGMWFIGRLQTERDKARVLEGLKGSSHGDMDVDKLNKMIAATGNRVFMLRSVYEKQPLLFETRWTLSYLRGPLTLPQIARLTTHAPEKTTAKKPANQDATQSDEKPIVPADLPELFGRAAEGQNVVYKPFIMGIGKLHYVDAKNKIDTWQEISVLTSIDDDGKNVLWETSDLIPDLKSQLDKQALPNSTFMLLPSGIAKNYNSFQKSFMAYLYQSQPLTLYQAVQAGLTSKPGETEGEFRIRLSTLLKEQHDDALAKLESASIGKIKIMEERINRMEGKAADVQHKALWQKINAFISFLAALLGILFGKKITKGTLSQTGTTLRRAGKISEGSQAVGRVENELTSVQQRLEDQQSQLDEEKRNLAIKFDPDKATVESVKIPPRKSDIAVEKIALVWWPQNTARP